MVHAKKAAKNEVTANGYKVYLTAEVNKKAAAVAAMIHRCNSHLLKRIIQLKSEIAVKEAALQMQKPPNDSNSEVHARHTAMFHADILQKQDDLDKLNSRHAQLCAKLNAKIGKAESVIHKHRAKAQNKYSKFLMLKKENGEGDIVFGESSTVALAPFYHLLHESEV